MSVRPRDARERASVLEPVRCGPTQSAPAVSPMVSTRAHPDSAAGDGYSSIELGESVRASLMLAPKGRGTLAEQAREVFLVQRQTLQNQRYPMTVTSQTVFLKDSSHLAECQRLISDYYGSKLPATNYVFQPPCSGAALAVEAWAIGGKDVQVEHFGPHTTAVSYHGTRWIYCAGIRSAQPESSVYQQTGQVLRSLKAAVAAAGSGFERIVRTWFYLSAITEAESGIQRYKELNRARADFYRDVQFHCSPSEPS